MQRVGGSWGGGAVRQGACPHRGEAFTAQSACIVSHIVTFTEVGSSFVDQLCADFLYRSIRSLSTSGPQQHEHSPVCSRHAQRRCADLPTTSAPPGCLFSHSESACRVFVLIIVLSAVRVALVAAAAVFKECWVTVGHPRSRLPTFPDFFLFFLCKQTTWRALLQSPLAPMLCESQPAGTAREGLVPLTCTHWSYKISGWTRSSRSLLDVLVFRIFVTLKVPDQTHFNISQR